MRNRKADSGIKWLIFFYCAILVQNLAVFQKMRPHPLFASVFLGTLIYVIFGFIRRRGDSRVMAIGFHIVFQVIESLAVSQAAGQEVFNQTQLPYNLFPVFRVTVYLVFGIITLINVSAVKYLLRNKGYFSPAVQSDQG